jgi:predicted RNase H-like nuclease
MLFVGIDLGWVHGASGVALLEQAGRRLKLRDLARFNTRESILSWLDEKLGAEPCFTGLDAPVQVRNRNGMREADRLAHRLFGAQKAGCYPVNLGMEFVPGILRFVNALEERGFETDLPEVAQQRGRKVFEVYPHAASLRLFGLKQVLRYKKGPLDARREALAKYRELLASGLEKREPAFGARNLPVAGGSGAELKAAEDQLDALLCAYVAAHYWYWGAAKNNVLGGALVVPSF